MTRTEKIYAQALEWICYQRFNADTAGQTALDLQARAGRALAEAARPGPAKEQKDAAPQSSKTLAEFIARRIFEAGNSSTDKCSRIQYKIGMPEREGAGWSEQPLAHFIEKAIEELSTQGTGTRSFDKSPGPHAAKCSA